MSIELFNDGYVRGVLIGCGKVISNDSKRRFSIFMETSSFDLSNHFCDRLKACIGKEPKKYSRTKNGLNIWSIVHYGKEDVTNFFNKYPFKQGSYDWSVPKMTYEDKHFRRGFLQGYFDAKGKIRVRYRKRSEGSKMKFEKVMGVRINSVNQKGISEVLALLNSLGIMGNICKSGKSFILDIEGKRRTTIFADKVDFGILSKKAEIENLLKAPSFEGNT